MTLTLGTECSGICAPSVALSLLGVGVDYRFACEYDPHCRKQLVHHYKPKTLYENMTTRDVTKMESVDLYVVGSPCQSYSYLGNRKGDADGRGLLVYKAVEYIETHKPKYFILENVKGFYTAREGKVFAQIMFRLNNLDNYSIGAATLNTKDYGVPQSRQRMYVVGVPKDQHFEFPLISPCPPLADFLENSTAEATLTPFAEASLGFYREKIPHLDENCHVVDLSVTKDYVRSGKVNICPCLRVNSSRFYVTTLRRYLTTRECLRLQGFPDSWESVCSDTQTRKQCGNAMSVNVLVKLFQRILTEIS